MNADLFVEGSIYYYENKTNTKKDYADKKLNHDFIVSRPVYILGSRDIEEDENFTVNVLVITSSAKRIGIPINIDGFKDGKVLPCSIRSIHKEYLTKYMGQVSDKFKEEVNNAVSYHLGFSDEVPKYLIDYRNKQEALNKKIEKLSIKERILYNFIKEKCLFRDIFYVPQNELFELYLKKCPNDETYKRSQNFSRALFKVLNIFDNIEIERRSSSNIIHGLSINGKVYKDTKVETLGTISHKKSIITPSALLNSDSVNDLECLSNDDLIKLLDARSKRTYERLDMIQKIANYTKSAYHLDINNIDNNDIHIIKQLIDNDVNEQKKKMFTQLDKGLSPYRLTAVNKYLFYICENDELMRHISENHLKKGGLSKMRKNIRNDIKHFFVKIKL